MAIAPQILPVPHRPPRGRGRPRTEGVTRPPCPRGHEGSVQLNGYILSRSTAHERPRYRCVPYDGTPPHRFSPLLPTRHELHTGSGSHECEACERPLRRTDGPRTGHAYEFAVREIALPDFSFVVFLAERPDWVYLLTAYWVKNPWRRDKYRRECEASKKR